MELEYLEEYMQIMTPIAEALDFMQSETNMYFGYFIPTLVSLKVKMRRLESVGLKVLHSVNLQMQSALLKRFTKYFVLSGEDAWDAAVAAMVLPDIKLKFCQILCETSKEISREYCLFKLKEYALQFWTNVVPVSHTAAVSSNSSFLDFGDESNETTGESEDWHDSEINKQVNLYLNDADTNFTCLNQYPIIKQIFLKYNTPLPSSAPVERLFSFAGIVNASRRQCLSDLHFEKIVLQKANANM